VAEDNTRPVPVGLGPLNEVWMGVTPEIGLSYQKRWKQCRRVRCVLSSS